MQTQQIEEQKVFERSKILTDVSSHYCPGCHHGIAHRLVAETLFEMDIAQDTICIGSIGCSVFIYNYIDVDCVEAPHGRAPAVATGVKRARKDKIVFTYQGDGDLASIGLAEIIHCANRGEKVTVVFVNNTVYGMTGGQMAPTTLVGQKTTTCPGGRCIDQQGGPLHMVEIISGLGGTAYAARVAVNNIKNINTAKKAVRKAFQCQQDGTGFGFVEILATCPTNWRMDPVTANKRITEEMIPVFPLGTYKDISENK